MNSFSDKDLAILRSVFDKFDINKSNSLSLTQFINILVKLQKVIPGMDKDEFKIATAVFTLYDKDNTGSLSFEEFCGWWKSEYLVYNKGKSLSHFLGKKKELLLKAYDLYKKYSEKDGLTYNGFFEMLDNLNIVYDEDDFDRLDKDFDGILSFNEFCFWLSANDAWMFKPL